MGKSPWYRWPENKLTGIVPWFVVLRRLFFWPFLFIGACIIFLAVLGGYGFREAMITWKNMF